MTEIDDDTAMKMLRLRVIGHSERKIAAVFKVSQTAARNAINRMLPIVDTAYRVQAHGLELARLDELQAAYHEKAASGNNETAAALCLKIGEQRSALLGVNAPTRLDMQLVEAASAPVLTTTDRIQLAIDRIVNDPLYGGGKPKANGNGHAEPDELGLLEPPKPSEPEPAA